MGGEKTYKIEPQDPITLSKYSVLQRLQWYKPDIPFCWGSYQNIISASLPGHDITLKNLSWIVKESNVVNDKLIKLVL